MPTTPRSDEPADPMVSAIREAEAVRGTTSPNPWVGAVVWTEGSETGRGATQPPGGPHAEVVALAAAGTRAHGATMYVTLEPCVHHGRTPPCTSAILDAGIARVVVGIEDPDPKVSGQGIAALRSAGVEVEVGCRAAEVSEQLAPYRKHRTTGRPWVVLKLALTADGRIAAPDGSSKWITGPEARADVHRLRAISDAILVGAGTVRRDDPALTVRLGLGGGVPDSAPGGAGVEATPAIRDPIRVVLGSAPVGARVAPCREMSGTPESVLDELGRDGVIQLLVEGGATVAHAFHSRSLVDRYVLYVAPALAGGDDGRPVFAGPGARSIGEMWRGRFLSVERLGEDLRVELAP